MCKAHRRETMSTRHVTNVLRRLILAALVGAALVGSRSASAGQIDDMEITATALTSGVVSATNKVSFDGNIRWVAICVPSGGTSCVTVAVSPGLSQPAVNLYSSGTNAVTSDATEFTTQPPHTSAGSAVSAGYELCPVAAGDLVTMSLSNTTANAKSYRAVIRIERTAWK